MMVESAEQRVEEGKRKLVLEILRELKSPAENGEAPYEELRRRLKNLLTVRMQDLEEQTLSKVEALLSVELQGAELTDARDLPRLGQHGVSIWQGDITKLRVGAIVNAANSQMCGCFQPDHPCIDNAIHCAAGPRLRMACKALMTEQGHEEPTGRAKITSAFCLPSDYVLHTVGPIIRGELQPQALESSYTSCLNLAAQFGVSSIAFCCISTGIFGYPQEEAALVALAAVRKWVQSHPQTKMHVVFNTFLAKDTEIYNRLAPQMLGPRDASKKQQSVSRMTEAQQIALAGRWIQDADAVLICAGAGMSAQDGQDVYVNPQDFARHYPELASYGYQTAYECMGLFSDPRVPDQVKWRYQAQHMKNMRYLFPPNNGHKLLLDMVSEKEHFVWTSNVDGCFERSGFSRERVYTPQGEWGFYQCKGPCKPDSVFPSEQMIDRVITSKGAWIPSCPNCSGEVFGNVRGGGWFLHRKYEETSGSVEKWIESVMQRQLKLVILEIGAGFNTPTVTRFAMESISCEYSRARMVRINPSEHQVPADISRALGFKRGWQVLQEIKTAGQQLSELQAMALEEYVVSERTATQAQKGSHVRQLRKRFGHFDWRVFLRQLRD